MRIYRDNMPVVLGDNSITVGGRVIDIMKYSQIQRLYPSAYARQNYFAVIDGISPDQYTVTNTYASGTYNVAYSTTTGNPTYAPNLVFHKPIPETIASHDATWQNSEYSSTGDYLKANGIGGMLGDWITIEMPVKILLTRYVFAPSAHLVSYNGGAPRFYAIFGRNNVTDTWEKIIEETITASNYNFPYYTFGNIAYDKTLSSRLTGDKKFSSFALVVNKTLSRVVLAFAEWEIYGIEDDSQWTYNTSNTNVYYMGNVGIITNNPTNVLEVSGNTHSTTYSAGKKTFKIEHPLKINKWLYHGCIEGPRFDNIYRGKKLIIDGKAEVNIDIECNTTGGMTPGTFPALNTNYQLYLQNNATYDVVKGTINESTINIECENIIDEIEVDWLVVGERHDEHVISTPLTDSDGNLICEHDMSSYINPNDTEFENIPVTNIDITD
jgi:hypothetical protein